MSPPTIDELGKIEAADKLRIASVRRDGTLREPVTIWVGRQVASQEPGDLKVRA
jgi:hypothetical protein